MRASTDAVRNRAAPPDDPLLTAAQAAAEIGVSRASLYRMTDEGRLPAPLYPAGRAPRWRRSELLAALEATRQKPAAAKAARRAAIIAAAKNDETRAA